MAHTFRKILCPIDFDDNSMAALEIACKVALQNDASLCLMHVVDVPAHSTEMPPEALKPYVGSSWYAMAWAVPGLGGGA